MRKDIEEALQRNKEANKLFTTFMFNKNYEKIETYIDKDETVLYIRNGNVNLNNSKMMKPNSFSIKDKTPAIVAVTNKRVLIYYRILFNERLEQIPVKEIRSYDFMRSSITSGVFRIKSLTKSVDIDLTCKAKEIELLNTALKKVTDSVQVEDITTNGEVNKSDDFSDTTKKLKELAELKKEGIITNDEFEAMKKKLLDKI